MREREMQHQYVTPLDSLLFFAYLCGVHCPCFQYQGGGEDVSLGCLCIEFSLDRILVIKSQAL